MITISNYTSRASYGILPLNYIRQGEEAIKETDYEIMLHYIQLVEGLVGVEHIRGRSMLWKLATEKGQ